MATVEERLAKLFEGEGGVIAVYLFGSQVKGDTDKFSDFDLAVLFQENWQVENRWNIVGDLLGRAFSVVGQDKADVVDLSGQPLWFQREVVRTGKVIYEADRERRVIYEEELRRRCREAGLAENLEDRKMRKQEVQINLDTIEENLKRLEGLNRFSYEEFTADFRNLYSAVHLLQTSIEALVDISRYVIRSLGLPGPEKLWQVPKVLADSGYIRREEVDIYIQMARFRNLVVHHYYKVKPEEVYRILKENLVDLRRWRDGLLGIIKG